jgi:hypothetical protein
LPNSTRSTAVHNEVAHQGDGSEASFQKAIYVNRASASLPKAIGKKKISDPITENKVWTSSKKFIDEAHANGCDLALIFAQYETLDYWAIAEEIKVDPAQKTIDFSFSSLQRIPDPVRYRHDLMVVSTGEPLPDNFIRSYALVKTPDFLKR